MVRVTTPVDAGSAQWGLQVQTTAGGSGPPVKWMVNDADPPFPATLVYAGPDTGVSDAVPVTVTEQTWCGSAGKAGNSNPNVPSAPVTRGVPRWNPQDPPTVGSAASARVAPPTDASVAATRSAPPTAVPAQRCRPVRTDRRRREPPFR